MKKSLVMLASAAIVIVACQESLNPTIDSGKGVYATIEQPDFISTKALDYSSDGKLTFKWAAGDQIMVYGSDASAIYKVGEDGSSVTKLESESFTLNNNLTYYTFSPVEGTLSEAPKTAIPVSFENQVQTANSNTEHLRLNQYACAEAKVENNSVNFQFLNQVAWVYYSHTFESEVKAAKVVMSVSEGEPFVLEGTLDATAGVSEKGYTTSIKATKTSNEMTLTLGENGFDIAEGTSLDAFFTVHPVDLTGEVVTVKVFDAEGTELSSESFAGRAIARNAFRKFTENSQKPVASIDGVEYVTVQAAIDAVNNGGTITLLTDTVNDNGLFLAAGEKEFTLDLNGYVFTAQANAGSTGTKNQVLHLEKGNKVTIKNGTIAAKGGNEQTKFIIQNYSDLTLEDVVIDAKGLNYPGQVCYAISNNCGNVLLTGTTSIINVPEGAIALDACKFANYEKPVVTLSTTGTIGGDIELSGGDLVLGADLNIEGTIVGEYKGESNIDLAKHTITAPKKVIYNKDATLSVKNGNLVSKTHVAVMVGNDTQTTLTSCKVTGVEGAVATGIASGATITIENGTYTATDNAVISGNGSKRDGEANHIVINRATLNGYITTQGYIACGIYAPWKDIFTINGITMNIENGVGVLVRGGKVEITKATLSSATRKITVSGTEAGWVGDNKNLIECKTLVVDKAAKYPDCENATITVDSGDYSDDSARDFLLSGYAILQSGERYKVVVETIGTDEASIEAGLKKNNSVTKVASDVNVECIYTEGKNNTLVLDNAVITGTGQGKLASDVLMTSKNLDIRGKGKIVSNIVNDTKNSQSSAIRVGGGVVNIYDGVELDGGSGCHGNYAIRMISGTVNIYGGYFHSGPKEVGGQSEVIYLESGSLSTNKPILNIYDGVFESDGDASFLINCQDIYSSKCTINIMGGTFVGFNPADSAADKIDGKNANWVSDGYVSTQTTYNGKTAWVVSKVK